MWRPPESTAYRFLEFFAGGIAGRSGITRPRADGAHRLSRRVTGRAAIARGRAAVSIHLPWRKPRRAVTASAATSASTGRICRGRCNGPDQCGGSKHENSCHRIYLFHFGIRHSADVLDPHNQGTKGLFNYCGHGIAVGRQQFFHGRHAMYPQ